MQQYQDLPDFEAILGVSTSLRTLKSRAAKLAIVRAPLLLVGEPGVGKALVARACHTTSPRRLAPFLELGCASTPEHVADRRLFGDGQPGLLELADGGTVYLHEIGSLSPYLQGKLLRFLAEGTFRRVGSDRDQQVDVRIIAATHRDLDRMVREGSFLLDLRHRLDLVSLRVPSLRSRPDDIPVLARFFVERACAQVGRPTCRLAPEALAALLHAPWPGNVRELENVIFRAVTITERPVLELADLERAGCDVDPSPPNGEPANWHEAVSTFERGLLERLYVRYPSSRKLAARLSTSHTMIATKLRKYRIAR
jgi:transcriptional regulator of aroF, aroG, tyrA and aromatic amino acid transport